MWRKLRRSGGSREESGGDARGRRPMSNRRDHTVTEEDRGKPLMIVKPRKCRTTHNTM
jgi:hypothetical protein